ncbi:MAG: tol-pal system protein YbgF [Magnetococcales bacterium]|nr:tol-pal system protein YbgF [Magnetococcales bacterium]
MANPGRLMSKGGNEASLLPEKKAIQDGMVTISPATTGRGWLAFIPRQLVLTLMVLPLGLMLTSCVGAPPPEEAADPAPAAKKQPPPLSPLERKVVQLDRQVTDLKRKNEADRKQLAGLNQQLVNLGKEVDQLRGSLEVVQHDNKRLTENLADLEEERSSSPPPSTRYSEPTQPVIIGDTTQPTQSVMVTTPIPAQQNTRTTTPVQSKQPAKTVQKAPALPPIPDTPPATTTPREVYDQAFSRIKSLQYDQALVEFNSFLKWYPDDPLTDNAQYWVGEIYYVQGHFQDALKAFGEVLTRWPASDKVPGSLLKIGFSFYELNDVANSRATLDLLVKDYPSSPAVPKAKQRLKLIDAKMGN